MIAQVRPPGGSTLGGTTGTNYSAESYTKTEIRINGTRYRVTTFDYSVDLCAECTLMHLSTLPFFIQWDDCRSSSYPRSLRRVGHAHSTYRLACSVVCALLDYCNAVLVQRMADEITETFNVSGVRCHTRYSPRPNPDLVLDAARIEYSGPIPSDKKAVPSET